MKQRFNFRLDTDLISKAQDKGKDQTLTDIIEQGLRLYIQSDIVHTLSNFDVHTNGVSVHTDQTKVDEIVHTDDTSVHTPEPIVHTKAKKIKELKSVIKSIQQPIDTSGTVKTDDKGRKYMLFGNGKRYLPD